jgi:alpha-beta hydrolase superfamily lysophospholipase
MKKLLLLATFLLFSNIFQAQNVIGTWSGSLEIQGMNLPIVFNITKTENGLKSTMDSPKQGAKDIPVTSTKFENDTLSIVMQNLRLKYIGILEKGKIDGTFSQNGMKMPMVLTRMEAGSSSLKRPQTPKAPYDYSVEEVSFENPIEKNKLAGTLTLPPSKNQFPIVILITGSGSQNRDEEILGHKPFWVIADDFTKKGIGVLRLDDRGIGKSTEGIKNPTSANFATDISAAVDFLNKKGYKNIGLVGHSEGGMIAPIAAVSNKNVKFIVSMAGPGIPIDQLMLLQTEAVLNANATSKENIDSALKLNTKIYAFIKNYTGQNKQKDLEEFLVSELKKEQQNLTEDQILKTAKTQAEEISNPWFSYFLKYNPDAFWSKLKMPVLAINGSLDVQVLAKQNLNGIKKSLEKAGNKNFEIKEFEGKNHLFQDAKTGSVAEYGEIEQTIAPDVLNYMSSWILKQ